MLDLAHILADSEDGGLGRFIVFAIFIAIWIISAIASAIGKAMKKTPTQTQPPPDWGDGQIVVQPEDYRQVPPPIPVPPPMPRPTPNRQQTQQQQRKQQKQKQKRQQQQRPPAMPEPTLAMQSDSFAGDVAVAPTRGRPKRDAVAPNSVASNVRMLLQPGSVREAYVLSEILGKPKGME